jgi:glycosyltransferase involved in cell wall biosynthesis
MSADPPLVTVLTPVYNGAKYLVECIESVLAQTYQNWEYLIVNNCSTDGTLEIARKYASDDHRIKVVSNAQFVGGTENHNIAFRLTSPESKYCKVVSADDWLYPDCITRLVELAERHPRVGIVGAYAIRANGVHSLGLPHDTTVFSGPEVCRLYLLGAVHPFGTPSAVLYRADVVRSRFSFFPGSAPNADLAACLMSLRTSDFAFVHQVLSFERLHSEAASSGLRELNSFLLDRFEFLLEYGPIYLKTDEYKKRRGELLREYYDYLAGAVINLRNRKFWNYHKRRVRDLGYPLIGMRLMVAVCKKLLDLLFNPKHTIERIIGRLEVKW